MLDHDPFVSQSSVMVGLHSTNKRLYAEFAWLTKYRFLPLVLISRSLACSLWFQLPKITQCWKHFGNEFQYQAGSPNQIVRTSIRQPTTLESLTPKASRSFQLELTLFELEHRTLIQAKVATHESPIIEQRISERVIPAYLRTHQVNVNAAP